MLADYLRAIHELKARDDVTRKAIARFLSRAASIGDRSLELSLSIPSDATDPEFEGRTKSERVDARQRHVLKPAEDTRESLPSELVEIEPRPDAEGRSTVDDSDLLPPLKLDRRAPTILPYCPLFAPQECRAIISQSLAAKTHSTVLDLDEIVRLVSQARPINRLPLLPLYTLSRGVQLLIDLGPGMEPFAVDRARITQDIRELAGNVEWLRFHDSPLNGVLIEDAFQARPYLFPESGVPILVVSDLGMNRWSPRIAPGAIEKWIGFAKRAAERDCPLIALVPLDRADWVPALERRIRMILWDRETSARSVRQCFTMYGHDRLRHPRRRMGRLLNFKQTLSLAVRAEPELIRALRVELFPSLGVSAEAALWQDPGVQTHNTMGLVFKSDRRQQLQAALAEQPKLFEAARQIIESLHRDISPAIRIEEELAYHTLSKQPGSWERAAQTTWRIVATLSKDRRETFSRWALHATLRMPESLKKTREGIHLQQGLAARNPDLAEGLLAELSEKDQVIPAWLRPSDTSNSVQVGVRLVRDGFEVGTLSLADAHPLVLPRMSEPWLDLAPAYDVETVPGSFHRVHFQLPEGGRYEATSTAGFILRTPLGQSYRLAPRKAGRRYGAAPLLLFKSPEESSFGSTFEGAEVTVEYRDEIQVTRGTVWTPRPNHPYRQAVEAVRGAFSGMELNQILGVNRFIVDVSCAWVPWEVILGGMQGALRPYLRASHGNRPLLKGSTTVHTLTINHTGANFGGSIWGKAPSDLPWTYVQAPISGDINWELALGEQQILHIIADPIETRGVVRLQLDDSDDDSEYRDVTQPQRGMLLRSDEAFKLLPNIRACLLQPPIVTAERARTGADREKAGFLRRFGAELQQQGFPLVFVIPSLDWNMAERSIAHLVSAVSQSEALEEHVQSTVAARKEVLSLKGSSDDGIECAFDFCIYGG
jgi:hypothetical protein